MDDLDDDFVDDDLLEPYLPVDNSISDRGMEQIGGAAGGIGGLGTPIQAGAGWAATDILLYIFLAAVIFFVGKNLSCLFNTADEAAFKINKKINKKIDKDHDRGY